MHFVVAARAECPWRLARSLVVGSHRMSQERRKYYRYPATAGSETIVVRHHGVERPAKLVNLSSDGFRVDMEEESIVEVGDIVLMATSSGFHRVRVVNVSRENGTLQLGLQRLQDLPASALEKHEEQHGRSQKKKRPKVPVATLVGQLAVPFVLGAVILGGIAWAWTTDSDPVGTVAQDRFVTPTSDYFAKRRRQPAEIEVVTTSDEKPKRRFVSPAAADASGSTLWSPGTKSAAPTESNASRPEGSGPSGEITDNRSPATFQPLASVPTVFDPGADALYSIKSALSTAKRENKRVLVEFGANKCDSCSLLNAAFTQDAEIAAVFQKAFVLVLVDLESNQKVVARYIDDARERVPFLALLNREGKVLKRQRTDQLGSGSKLDVGKVKEFLHQWASAG